MLLTFHGCSFPVRYKRLSSSRHSGPLTLTILLLFSHVAWALVINTEFRHISWDWTFILCILTSCGSLIVSIFCKKKFLWWEMRATLICGYKENTLNAIWNYTSLVKWQSLFSFRVYDLLSCRYMPRFILLGMYSVEYALSPIRQLLVTLKIKMLLLLH